MKKKSYSCFPIFLLFFLSFTLNLLQAQNALQNFNRNWRFAKGEFVEQVREVKFNDSNWEQVTLPHDWAIAGPFDETQNGYAGKLPWRGVGWYRKEFTLDEADSTRQIYLDFDGVMAFPEIYINGQLAGVWDYGYTAFRVDVTPFVYFGKKNVIAVKVNTRKHGTRWYPGAGIYRKVVLNISEPIHVSQWGTFITTPKISNNEAEVSVSATIENHLKRAHKVNVEVILFDPENRKVARAHEQITIPAKGNENCELKLKVKNPVRWDIENPKLYTAEVRIFLVDVLLDTDKNTFGFRTFEFTADDGFHLNGRRVQLFGVNLHHDQGPLGAAFYPRAMERQLEIMRDMGCNAIRTSHNPGAAELVKLCDRMGFVVWDEVFDKWEDKADRIKGEPPLEKHGEKHIRSLVMRDRNSPSVVVWSIGNEIGNQPWDKEGKSGERVKFMSDFFRKYDPTRPVGMACHISATADEPILDALELTGWNYSRRYDKMVIKYPDKPLIYSESASALSTRGFYQLPLPASKCDYSSRHQVDSYDMCAAPWSDLADWEFQLMETDKYVAGEFVWTGFDYLGEPTPFSREARSSYFGIVDLCGIPKDRFYLYRSHWRPDEPTIHILPHWNWPEHNGQNVPVYVYTNGDEGELFLNGKSLGRRKKTDGTGKAENLAKGKPVSQNDGQADYAYPAKFANDELPYTRWSAPLGEGEPWWQVDLKKVQSIGYIVIHFEQSVRSYRYKIKVSTDGANWATIVEQGQSQNYLSEIDYDVQAEGRYVKIEFEKRRRSTPSIREFSVYKTQTESPYYAVTDRYRLRWLDVTYEPGELKAVAYKKGKKIGEAVMKTAGNPTAIRLTPDRIQMAATGEDLCYVLVEAVDDQGNLCPLAENMIHFQVDGPAEIAGVGNGNPLSYEPFQANYRKLFYGKAILILKSGYAETGTVTVTALGKGLKDATVAIEVK